MNRAVTWMLAGAMAVSLHSVAFAQDEEAPAVESKPVPASEVDPAEYVDLLAEGKDGDILGIVFDVVLDGSGKATTIVVELFDEDDGAAEDEGDVAAEDTAEEEPEAAEGAEGEGTDEAVMIGKLVGISPKGAMVDTGRDLIMLPSVTAAQAQNMPEFSYKAGMKSVGHPDGYPADE
jgi:hypothetical protein